MARFKIVGNLNPVVGVPEVYSIVELKQQSFSINNSPVDFTFFSSKTKWKMWVYEYGYWRQVKGDQKNGATVIFTFYQKSLYCKALRMKAEANGEEVTLDIKTQKAKQEEILKIDILNSNHDKPKKKFAYSDLITARVHAVNLELTPITVTLWEDDASGAGHNKTNTLIESKEADIINGRADVNFYLSPNFSALANSKFASGTASEGKEHEYYVTAESKYSQPSLVASPNFNIANDIVMPTYDPINSLLTVEVPDEGEENKPKLVIFPLLVKPENDKENKWGKTRNWTAKQAANMTTFNSNRNNGKRKHAARDLYTNALEAVVAIADGIVLDIKSFYCETNQVSIRHTLNDGRDFIIRYGELDPKSITVKIGEKVNQKQEIGKTGKLLKYLRNEKKYVPLIEIDEVTVFMLHFEYFDGSLKFDLNKSPLSNESKPYNRRSDLVDSLKILQEGYNNSFGSNATVNNDESRVFTEHDARLALMKIYDLYGIEMARNIEMMYRWECDHFRSGQYLYCGAPGMEVSGQAVPPGYGWDESLYKKHPEYTPIGLWEKHENKGKSGAGGNKQVTDRPKKYIKFPSVEAGMMYVASYIIRHDGNIGRWHSTDVTIQKNYIRDINSTIPRITNQF